MKAKGKNYSVTCSLIRKIIEQLLEPLIFNNLDSQNRSDNPSIQENLSLIVRFLARKSTNEKSLRT